MKTLLKHKCEKCGIKTNEIFPMRINYIWKDNNTSIKNSTRICLCKNCHSKYEEEIWR